METLGSRLEFGAPVDGNRLHQTGRGRAVGAGTEIDLSPFPVATTRCAIGGSCLVEPTAPRAHGSCGLRGDLRVFLCFY